MDTIRYGSCVLQIDILRSDLNVDQSRLDISVPHESHEGRQTDAFPHHVRGKRMPEAMRVGEFDASRLAVIAEQGAQPAAVMRAPRARPLSETNSAALPGLGLSARRY